MIFLKLNIENDIIMSIHGFNKNIFDNYKMMFEEKSIIMSNDVHITKENEHILYLYLNVRQYKYLIFCLDRQLLVSVIIYFIRPENNNRYYYILFFYEINMIVYVTDFESIKVFEQHEEMSFLNFNELEERLSYSANEDFIKCMRKRFLK
jgi:hypothetical protein